MSYFVRFCFIMVTGLCVMFYVFAGHENMPFLAQATSCVGTWLGLIALTAPASKE